MQCFLRLVVNVSCVLGEMCLELADSLRCFVSLGYGPCRDLGVRTMVENLGERDAVLLEFSSSSLEEHAVVPGR